MNAFNTKIMKPLVYLAGAIIAGALGLSAQTVNINCGGWDFTATDGTQWKGDSNYTGGDLLYTGNSIAGVQPQDLSLYRSARAGLYGDFSYSIPVPNGTYTVTLKMAEIQFATKGDRVFNVAINGSQVLSNFDILAHVAPLTPLVQQFPVSVSNGVVKIDVTGVVRRGILNAIQISPSTATTTTTPPPPATTTAATGGTTVTSTTTQAAININCGGSDLTAADGTKWTGDHGYTGGDLLYSGGSIVNVAPSDMALYRGARAGLYGDFSYAIPMANGTYTVTLGFAEIQYANKGERVFNVAINGSQVLSNFDILSQVPVYTPLVKQFTANVTDGALHIDVTGVVRRGILNVIQVGGGSLTTTPTTTTTTPTTPAAALALSGSALSFSGTAGASNPSAQSVSVSNSGGGTLSWTAASNMGWLTVSPASGTNSGTLAIGANLSGVGPGTYGGTITVSSNGGSKTVAVSLSVAPAPVTPTPPTTPVTIPTTSGNNWYVSTSGSAGGSGSISSPWDIQTALNQPSSVKPGDTIWVRGGKYGGGASNSLIGSKLVGTASAPIIVRAYPKERAIIDAWLQVGCCDGAPNPSAGSYTWFWGLEFAGYNPDRTSGTSGPPQWAAQQNHNGADSWGAGTKFINCIVHDTGGGISIWNAANAEATGNIVYNIGGYGTDRGHGHAFYFQNQAPSVLKANDNIAFNQFDIGIQAYGSSGVPLDNMQFRGNAIFNSGSLYGQLADNLMIGAGNGPSGIVLDTNFFYFDPANNSGYNELGYLWALHAHDVVATNNYFVGGANAIDVERWNTATFQNNTVYSQFINAMVITGTDQTTGSYNFANNHYYGSGQFWVDLSCDSWPCPSNRTVDFNGWKAATGLDSSSTFTAGAPTGVSTTVRPNGYEPGRANIVIFNWGLAPSVQVDLSASGIKVGDAYQIRDAQNWFNGPVVSGTYSGSPVTIPMSGLVVAQPVGSVPHPAVHTAPQFGTFVLLSGAAMNVF